MSEESSAACSRPTLFIFASLSAGKFLEMVRQQLSQDFSEMRSVSSENLLYIKEDLIIPHVRDAASYPFFLSEYCSLERGFSREQSKHVPRRVSNDMPHTRPVQPARRSVDGD